MNASLLKLSKIALNKERLIIGLMSGTSLDGLDIALCKICGTGESTNIQLIAFETISYTIELKNQLKEICFKKTVDLEKVCLLNEHIGSLHATLINQFLTRYHYQNTQIDLIASHGQTIYHTPLSSRLLDGYGNGTLQIGDADQIAVKTGIITVSDFRQKHIAQGKEGAPLALFGDYLLFKTELENRVLLNIGGIANFTIIPKKTTFNQVICTDVGPGNTLMDQFINKKDNHLFFDVDAKVASMGKVNEALLNALLANEFFEKEFPKSTGPELFNDVYLQNALLVLDKKSISNEDIMATLNRFTAVCIAKAMDKYEEELDDAAIYISGGGVHNPLLMKHLKQLLPFARFKNTLDLGISADAKEAVLFALLANETIAGNYKFFDEGAKSLGKISFPN